MERKINMIGNYFYFYFNLGEDHYSIFKFDENDAGLKF